MNMQFELSAPEVLMATKARTKVRESNMEMLRIIAMTMIVSGHIFFHGLQHTVRPTAFYMGASSLFVCGVNLFFLISGWFGMRFSMRSLVKLIATTFFFTAVNIGVALACGVNLELQTYLDTLFFPVSRGDYWFIMVYMCLLILAPLINAGIEHLPERVFSNMLLLFTVFNLYIGWYGNNYVNQNGYTIIQAVWLYCVARWLRANGPLFDRLPRICYLWGFLLFSVCTSIAMMATFNFGWYRYNSPFVVLASVSLFLFFTRLKFQSRKVNFVAGAALGCYMVQDGIFGHSYLYQQIEATYLGIIKTHPYVQAIAICVALFVCLVAAYWVVSLLLTPVANAFGRGVYSLLERLKRLRAKSSIAS